MSEYKNNFLLCPGYKQNRLKCAISLSQTQQKVPYGLALSGVLNLTKNHGADNFKIHEEACHHEPQGVEFRCGLKYKKEIECNNEKHLIFSQKWKIQGQQMK